jgi:hypothetical protein
MADPILAVDGCLYLKKLAAFFFNFFLLVQRFQCLFCLSLFAIHFEFEPSSQMQPCQIMKVSKFFLKLLQLFVMENSLFF